MPAPRSTWAVYRRLVLFARPYMGRLLVGVLAGFVGGGSLFGILNLSSGVIRPFEERPGKAGESATSIQATLDHGATRQFEKMTRWSERLGVQATDADGRITWQLMALSLVGLPLLVLVRSLANYLNRYCLSWVGSRVVKDLRDALFDGLQSQSLAFFGKCDVGQLISRCTNDATVVEHVISSTVADLLRAPAELVVAAVFVVVFAVSNRVVGLVAVGVLVFPLCVLPIVWLGRYVKRFMRSALDRLSDLVSRMHENFTGIRVVKAFHTEQMESCRFEKMNDSYFRSVVMALRAELLMTPLMEGVALIVACAFFVYCYAKGVKLYQILPIGIAAVLAYRPIKQLAKLNANLQRGAAALDRIFDLLDADTHLREDPAPLRLGGFNDKIVFDHVHFQYAPDSPEVVHDICLEIPRGSVVALVGQTGSGKTTLANLLARFYDPTQGAVRMDGTDLRKVEIASLRRLIGVVTQETVLFNDTVAANIAYGTETATRAQIEEAARQANAHAFIEADPSGYERVVGEKGFVLSGGERQRIALARAILRDPPILVLDEATSALDTVTERLVQEAIARLMQHRTVFAIAHRLSTVKHADQILLVEAGCVVERGTHEELYRAGGRYRRLCDMQVLD